MRVIDASAVPDAVARFRADYRAHEVPPAYRGAVHLLITFGGGSAVLLACVLRIEAPQPLEWLTVPLAFLYANLAEYVGHRFPMHHPVRGLGLVYRRHAGQHHRYFSHEAMALTDQRDLRAVLFPPMLVVFFFGAFAVPVWFLLAWAASANVAWLFIATGLAYFLMYEVLHLSWHAPAGSWVARLALVRRMGRLHRRHHDPARMARCNFNITWPIGDLVFGTFSTRDD
jgi:hypothetical protein